MLTENNVKKLCFQIQKFSEVKFNCLMILPRGDKAKQL